jgi:hypothetical protein
LRSEPAQQDANGDGHQDLEIEGSQQPGHSIRGYRPGDMITA